MEASPAPSRSATSSASTTSRARPTACRWRASPRRRPRCRTPASPRSPSAADQAAAVLASLETTLRERMAHHAVPGIALALIADSEIATEAAHGMKEAGGGDPVTPVTRFQACSISKPVAVFGMLRLVEQGVVDLDADVNDMLTSWRVTPHAAWQPRVTLRQIAS